MADDMDDIEDMLEAPYKNVNTSNNQVSIFKFKLIFFVAHLFWNFKAIELIQTLDIFEI